MILDEILGHLESDGVGASGSNLFWDFLPDTPDRCVSIFEYAGERPQRTKGGVYRMLPRLQVITRAPDFEAAMTKALEVYTSLARVDGAVLNGTFYDRIDPLQEPFTDPSGRDGRGRSRVLCNYRLERRPPGAPAR